MKLKLIVVAALLLLCAILAGCGNTSEPTRESEPQSTETEPGIPETETEDESQMTDVSEYRINRSDLASSTVTDITVKLMKALETGTGIKMTIKTDFKYNPDTDGGIKEIVVGRAKSIPESENAWQSLAEDEYMISNTGSKILILSKDDIGTVYAVKRFMLAALNYSEDKYVNEPLGSTKIRVPEEKGYMEGQYLDSGRVVNLAEELTSDPIPYTEFGLGASATSIHYTNTSSRSWTGSIKDSSFVVECDVTKKSTNDPIVQIFISFPNVEHICIGIQGNFVRFGRGTYERGGATFIGNPDKYTFRIEVFPEIGTARYYVNRIFLGEMVCGGADDPLGLPAKVGFAAVGSNIDVDISNIHIEEIDDIEPRIYHDPGIRMTKELVYPKSEHAPAQTIYVVKAAGLSHDEILTLVTLQGIVNRTTPRIFMDYRSYNQDSNFINIEEEEAFLDLLRAKGRTLQTSTVDDLLVLFKDEYKGIIFGDAFANNYGENVTTSLSGILDGVYMSENRYNRLRDKVQKDILFRIDNRWKSDIDAYMWVWNTYKDQFNDRIMFYTPSNSQCSGHLAEACRDYAVMCRAFTFCTTGVQCVEDYDFYMGVMASNAVNSPLVGFANVGCFPEFEMFQVAGMLGKFWTYGFSCANMSLFNSLEVGELKQSQPAAPIERAKANTVYVTFDISEGDNLSWDYHMWPLMYRDEAARARTPKGFSLCGALYYVAPALIEYFYDNATPGDYFFLDGASISNIGSPDSYAAFFPEEERETIFLDMLEMLDYVAEKADISVVRGLVEVSDEITSVIAENCPHIAGVFSNYGNNSLKIGGSGHNYEKSIHMVDGIVRVRCYLTTFEGGLANGLNQIYNQARGGLHPVFAKVFLYCNPMLKDISVIEQYKAELEQTGFNIVYVRPDEFVRLYADYAG
ncbi:MAG: hypothetical protein IKS35_05770 [Clostridia bacterium]|nr:hypothetical protein [Clostridia bacterium]